MMSVEQVRGNSVEADAPGPQGCGTDAEAIFEQARRRRTRRQRACASAIGVMLLAGAGIWLSVGGGGGNAAVRGGDSDRPAATTTQSRSDSIARPAVRLAWIDSAGHLNIGDPATGADHAGPVIDRSSSAGSLVAAGGQLYWPDPVGAVAPIRAYDVATGEIRLLPRGLSVFSSGDKRHIYIVRNASTLLELPADGSGRAYMLRVPAGWYLNGNAYRWFPLEGPAAGGIIVYSRETDGLPPDNVSEGFWNPATGQVRILGRGYVIDAAYTPPGSRNGLILWTPPSPGIGEDYSLRITNTSTMATVTVRSPLHHGFVASGTLAFSPNGSQMAAFVRTAPLGSSNGMSKLAIVNTSTGAVRVVAGTTLDTTEDAFWAMWLPGGQQILAGAVGGAFVVNVRTLTARPFAFFDSTDGFSATVLPGRR